MRNVTNLIHLYLNPFFLTCLILFLFGCASNSTLTKNRNLIEKVIVKNNSELISDSNINFILELKKSRKEIPFNQISDFLSTEESARLNSKIRSGIIKKEQLICKTMFQTKKAANDSIIFTKPAQDQPFSDENVVLYLHSYQGYHLYFSFNEIYEIFLVAQKQIQDDLINVSYYHPSFTSSILSALKTNLSKFNIKLKHVELSEREIEKLKILTAAGLLEQELRDMHVELDPDKPLLQSGILRRWSSPKLTAAFQEKSILNQIKKSNKIKISKSLNYLIEKNVIKLD